MRSKTIPMCLAILCGLAAAAGANGLAGWLGGQWRLQRAWITDYAEATSTAQEQGKMLLVFFDQPGNTPLSERFERQMVCCPAVRRQLRDYVCVRLSVDAKIRVDGKDVRLMDHAAFGALEGQPGVAILDFAHEKAEYFGCVVSAVPSRNPEDLTLKAVQTLLSLPPGTPEQRARRYANCMTAKPTLAAPESAKRAEVAQKAKGRETVASVLEAETGLSWYTDYGRAAHAAKTQQKMLLIVFGTPGPRPSLDCLAPEAIVDPQVRQEAKGFVRLYVTTETEIVSGREKHKLLDDPSMVEMLGGTGMAIIDFAHKDSEQYGCVVSTFPVLQNQPYTTEQLLVILNLPPGSLTQRTLIYAVRIHPDRPASTDGEINLVLLEECMSHSRYQAEIRLQGHHRWGERFQRILGRLRDGRGASEVCAESWPNEGLLVAAIDCVQCWRQSSGHWSAVRAPQPLYGYDMQRGSNGIWYATGIFAQR